MAATIQLPVLRHHAELDFLYHQQSCSSLKTTVHQPFLLCYFTLRKDEGDFILNTAIFLVNIGSASLFSTRRRAVRASMYLLLLRVILVTRLLPAHARNHRPPNVAHQKDLLKAKPQRQTSEECRILCRPGSVKILKTRVNNSKLILTAKRLRNQNGNRNEIKLYICPIFRFAKQTFFGG